MGCTNLELPLDEATSLTSSSLSGPGSGAPKSSSYASAKSVKSKRKKILLFQAGDNIAGVGRRLGCIGRRHDQEREARERRGRSCREAAVGERNEDEDGGAEMGRWQGKMVNSHSFYFC
jgi:hypothetical protein